MSRVIVTAAAWTIGEPRIKELKHDQPPEFLWRILAEASVTDTDGEPISKLPKSVWSVHVTNASGATSAPSFSVGDITIFSTPLPGFYLFTVEEFPTSAWVAPTACGIVVKGTSRKLQVHGQVVVPIALAGPKVVETLTTPGF